MKIKNAFHALLATALTVLLAVSCSTTKQDKSSTEYYRNLLFSETSFDMERGSHKLTPEEAKTVNSYKFTYDDSGRLASVEYVRNGELLGYSSMRGASKIVYTYENGKQLKHFFDKDNKQIKADGKVYTYEYSLNENGVRSGLRFLDSI